MNICNSMELMKKYSNCPKCGSIHIGNGQGGVVVENNTFRRFCNCGYDVTLNSDGERIDTIKFNIELPIEDLRALRVFLGVQNWEDTFDLIEKYKLDENVDDIDNIISTLYERINQVL